MASSFETGIDWIDRALWQATGSGLAAGGSPVQSTTTTPPLDIVIPVHNAFDELRSCVDSMRLHTSHEHRIWLADDASTDPRIRTLGEELQESDSRFRYTARDSNGGFVRNVNEILARTDRDVVLLNSDTRVTDGWLDRLWRCLNSADRVGVVSPLSNNASLLSVTRSLDPQDDIEGIAADVAATATPSPVAIPTAVGFCMLITRALIDDIGLFDPAFSPGYGEEVDFCLRAWRHGYRVLACTDAFVYHKGSASFGDRLQTLWRRDNERLLNSRWPDYEAIVRGWWRKNPLRMQTERIAARQRRKPLVVHLLHRWNSPGGTEVLTRRLVQKLSDEFDHLIIVPALGGPQWADATVQSVSPGIELMNWNRDYLGDDWNVLGEPAGLNNPWLDDWLARVLVASRAEAVHIHHMLGWGSLMPPLIARTLGIPVILSLHCLHYLCADYNQIGPGGMPCGKPMVDSGDTCLNCLLPRTTTQLGDKHERLARYISRRRALSRQLLDACEVIAAPSRFLRDRMTESFGHRVASRIRLIPHEVPSPLRGRPTRVSGDKLIVAFLGGLKRLKGSETLLRAAASLSRATAIQIHLYGPDGDHDLDKVPIPDNCIWFGRYSSDDTDRVIRSADVVVVPSLFEETFSLVVSESWSNARPVIGSASGALAERISDDENGWLVPPDDAEALADKLCWLASPEGRTAVREISRRLAEGSHKPSVEANDPYRLIYRDLVGRSDEHSDRTPAAADIDPRQLQSIFERTEAAMTRAIDLARRPPKFRGNAQSSVDIAALIVRSPSDDRSDVTSTRVALERMSKLEAIIDDISGESVRRRLQQLDTSWVWLFRPGERPLENAENLVSAAILQYTASYRTICFDHVHADDQGKLHGVVFKGHWDKWLAASSRDLDAGWVVRREVLVELLASGAPVLDWPLPLLTDTSKRNIPVHVPAAIVARPDRQAMGRGSTQTTPLRSHESFETGSIPVEVINSSSRNDLRATLESLLQISDPVESVSILGSANPLAGDWPDDWQWLAFGGCPPSTKRVRLRMRAGMIVTDWRSIVEHLAFFDDRGITAVGFAVSSWAGRAISAMRVPGHDHDRIAAYPPWPGGSRPDVPTVRRADALTMDIALIDSHRLPAADARDAALMAPGVLLASDCHVARFRDRPRRLGSEPTPINRAFFSPRLSLSSPDWQSDSLRIQMPAIPDENPQVVAITPDEWASSHYRIDAPLDALYQHGRIAPPVIARVDSARLPRPDELQQLTTQTLLVHNCLSSEIPELARAAGCTLVYVLDDLLTALPGYNPFKQRQKPNVRNRLAHCLGQADRLVLTTQTLADELEADLGPLNCPICIIENALPADPWSSFARQSRPGGNERLRVGWAGGQQHEGDLRMIRDVVRTTADTVDWVFFGMCPDYLRPYVREIVAPVDRKDFPEKLASLRLDVAIAPLLDNRFNRCKSALKLLEFGSLGIPVIASNVQPYRSAPVLRVGQDCGQWIDALGTYVDDRDQIARHGTKLQEWVLERHQLSSRIDEWHDAVQSKTIKPDRQSSP